MATGGIEQGKPPIEVGASQLDFDYLHIINWKKAEAGRRRRQVHELNGIRVISLETAVAEGSCTSRRSRAARTASTSRRTATTSRVAASSIRTSTIYGFDKIKKAIESKNFEGKDRYGVPILKFDAVVAGKVELGAGPLHTQYDDKGNGYTSLYLESAVAKWTLGEPYHSGRRGLQARRQDLHPLQHRPPRDRRGRHDGSAGQVPRRAEQVVDRPLHERRPAAPAELPADRHLGREDGAARRHADRLRRAALRADGARRTSSRRTKSTTPGVVADDEPEEPERDRQREGGAHRPASRASSRSG